MKFCLLVIALIASLSVVLVPSPALAGDSWYVAATVRGGNIHTTSSWGHHTDGTMTGYFNVKCYKDGGGVKAKGVLVAVYQRHWVRFYGWKTRHVANRYPPCTGASPVHVVVPNLYGNNGNTTTYFKLRNLGNRGITRVTTKNLKIV